VTKERAYVTSMLIFQDMENEKKLTPGRYHSMVAPVPSEGEPVNKFDVNILMKTSYKHHHTTIK